MLDRNVDLTTDRLFHSKVSFRKSHPYIVNLKTKISDMIEWIDLSDLITKDLPQNILIHLTRMGYKVKNYEIYNNKDYDNICQKCGRRFSPLGLYSKEYCIRNANDDLCTECSNELNKNNILNKYNLK